MAPAFSYSVFIRLSWTAKLRRSTRLHAAMDWALSPVSWRHESIMSPYSTISIETRRCHISPHPASSLRRSHRIFPLDVGVPLRCVAMHLSVCSCDRTRSTPYGQARINSAAWWCAINPYIQDPEYDPDHSQKFVSFYFTTFYASATIWRRH